MECWGLKNPHIQAETKLSTENKKKGTGKMR